MSGTNLGGVSFAEAAAGIKAFVRSMQRVREGLAPIFRELLDNNEIETFTVTIATPRGTECRRIMRPRGGWSR